MSDVYAKVVTVIRRILAVPFWPFVLVTAAVFLAFFEHRLQHKSYYPALSKVVIGAGFLLGAWFYFSLWWYLH